MINNNHIGTVRFLVRVVLSIWILLAAFTIVGCQNEESEQVVMPDKICEPQAEAVDIAPKEDLLSQMIKDMTLSDMIYQMMFVTPESLSGYSPVVNVEDSLVSALAGKPVGGIIYFASNFENPYQTARLINDISSASRIPLFMGVDEEGGRVSRLGKNPDMNVTLHPPMSEIGSLKNPQTAYDTGAILGRELKGLGFNVDFAPNADVLINPDNTEIGNRSFGTDPSVVALMVENVVRGIKDNGVCAALKHFPGHGSTTVDSHTGYSSSSRTLEELRNCEFLPFKAGIEAGAEFVMVSHMTLTDATEEKIASSLSQEVITNMLREELGFEGIVITDSFSMGAITKIYTQSQATLMAVKAGADMILMPHNLQECHDALMNAVESGEISAQRIEQSVRRILELKITKNIINTNQ